jgi:AmmeMemoRadiSam system protein B
MAGACAPAGQADSSMDETVLKAEEEAVLAEEVQISETAGPVGIILPHHELASELIESAWTLGLESDPDLIVLIGPDHPGLADHPLIWTAETCASLQAEISPLAEDWISSGLGGQAMVADHSIETPLKYLPAEADEIPILAVTVPRGMEEDHIHRLVAGIQALDGNCLLVGSVDFSHGLTSEESEIKDQESFEWIEDRDYPAINNAGNEYFDGPEVVEIMIRCCTGQPEQVTRKDSADYGWSETLPGTSYQVIRFIP